MKISVSPMPKNAIDRAVQDGELTKFAKRHETTKNGRQDRSVRETQNQENKWLDRYERSDVIRTFDSLGYRLIRNVADVKERRVRFGSSISGGAKDLVFDGWYEAREWLKKAGFWKGK